MKMKKNKQNERDKVKNLGHNLLCPALAPNITLCITVACLTKPRFCGMYPKSPLFIGANTVPEIGSINPAIVLRRVVFPIPDSPVNTITSPGFTVNLSILTNGWLELYPIVKSLILTNGMVSLLSSIKNPSPHKYYAYWDYISYFPSKYAAIPGTFEMESE